MTVEGLEQNYYLTGNDIYVRVSETAKPSVYLDVTVINNNTGQQLGTLRPYPNIQNQYVFNICLPVRAMFPEPNNSVSSNMQEFTFHFVALLDDGTTENVSFTRFFVRGGVDRDGRRNWHLENGAPLYNGIWADFTGHTAVPMRASRIVGSNIVLYNPTEKLKVNLPNDCKPTPVMFLNSLGGYQYWLFEQRVDIDNSRAGRTKSNIAYKLNDVAVTQLATEQERFVTLQTKLPSAFYDLAKDLINSVEIYIHGRYHSNERDRWERVTLRGTNKLEKNTLTNVIDFDLNLTLPTYINRDI